MQNKAFLSAFRGERTDTTADPQPAPGEGTYTASVRQGRYPDSIKIYRSIVKIKND
jgi:hypothetical protein